MIGGSPHCGAPSRLITSRKKFARLLSRLTRHFPAVHMTWGAINELSTLTGYHALIDRTRHPLLRTMLSRLGPRRFRRYRRLVHRTAWARDHDSFGARREVV
jgi:hypothetical protein